MSTNTASLLRPPAVTFDCWATLLYETDRSLGPLARARRLGKVAGVDERHAALALQRAWRHHSALWHRRVVFNARDMARMALESLGVMLEPARVDELVTEFEDVILNHEICVVQGAGEALEQLARAGVRRALICDTGFSPGRTIRCLLARAGLLELLEVCVFSDEVGVPKPHPRMFSSAFDELGVPASRGVHVGDLRRSDIAGARAFGMGSVRMAAHHDDADVDTSANAGVIDCLSAGCDPVCERPEADAVVTSYSELLAVLGYA
ncbi:MAG TPA: HAD family hydrolase [Polyangiaceae bacterium]